MNLLAIPFDDSDMPVQGAFGVSADCQAQLVPDSMNMGRYLELQAQAARRKVCKNFDEVLADIRAGKFSSVKAFAATMGKSPSWANEYRRVVLNQKLMDAAQWKACFKKTKGEQ